MNRILVRATNWVGDAIMSLPALRALAAAFPRAELSVLARPWVAELYSREVFIHRVIPYTPAGGFRDLSAKRRLSMQLRAAGFDCAVLFQNAFEAAAVVRLAGIPRRIGYARDARSWLLTDPIPLPKPSEIPGHQRYYYLELLRRAGLIDRLPSDPLVQLTASPRAGPACIGVSPGAAYGTAKRWLPERFAQAAAELARTHNASVALFGSATERGLCEQVAGKIRGAGVEAHNYAGETSLGEFMDLAAACRLFLTNDSGGMHIAAALGVPTLAIFGATDDVATGPCGPHTRVLRHAVECSPCLLRECPIDHRCMTGVTVERVTQASLALWSQTS